MSPPRVFIAGATGYTGRHLVRICAERGLHTVAHVRPDSPRLAEWRREFGTVDAEVDETPWEDAAMRETLRRRRPTHLFMLLGTTRARSRRAQQAGGPVETYDTVDYALPHLLIEAARELARDDATLRPVLVYLSAVGAREDTRNAYLRVRGRLERELRESGLPWLAARPAFITGGDRDERRPLERVTGTAFDLLLAPLALLGAGHVRARYASLSGAQLAAGLASVVFDERRSDAVVMADELRG
jgi:uncharacterized protein YbjT (DUF2867 family)